MKNEGVKLEKGTGEIVSTKSKEVKPQYQVAIDEARHEVYENGRLVALTPKEWEVLVILTKARGEVVDRKRILTRVWGDNYATVDTRTVDQHVARLRGALRQSSNVISTVTNFGYRIDIKRVGFLSAEPDPQWTGMVKTIVRKFGSKVRSRLVVEVEHAVPSIVPGVLVKFTMVD